MNNIKANSINTNTKDILVRIKELEQQKERLFELRKEEVFNILQASGGIGLDNRLIAGLAYFVASPESKDSPFLQQLKELGGRVPSRAKKPAKKRAS